MVKKKTRVPDLKETTEFIDILEIERQERDAFTRDLVSDINSGRHGMDDYFSETGRRIRPAKGCE